MNNEEEILTLLATHGPLTAAVDAISWQDYLGGIIQFHCEDRPNHAVNFFFFNENHAMLIINFLFDL